MNREDLFENLHRARGPIAKAELLRNRFSKLSAREGQYVVKIFTGDLRIGLREGLVEEAIAKAFGVSLEQVREANMLLGDIGQTALLASRNELARAELSLFRPIKCMLATPEPTAEAVWERFAEAARTGGERASFCADYRLSGGQVRRHSRAVAPQCATGRDFLSRFAAYHGSIPRVGR